jgi:hypothetical protein
MVPDAADRAAVALEGLPALPGRVRFTYVDDRVLVARDVADRPLVLERLDA